MVIITPGDFEVEYERTGTHWPKRYEITIEFETDEEGDGYSLTMDLEYNQELNTTNIASRKIITAEFVEKAIEVLLRKIDEKYDFEVTELTRFYVTEKKTIRRTPSNSDE